MTELLSAPVLFFLLGVIACLVRSDLDLPQPIPKLLSFYLLVAIGLKGGVELQSAGLQPEVVAGLGAAIALSAVVPIWTFFILRKRLGTSTAAGVAATYGSISAVTFIIATDFLDTRGIVHGGHMVAAMALMESPAIIVGIVLARRFATPAEKAAFAPSDTPGIGPEEEPPSKRPHHSGGWGNLLHEAFFNSAVMLLVGSMAIGLLVGKEGVADLSPLLVGPFKGVLCLFLLDMGLVAARRLGDLWRSGIWAMGFGLVSPPIHAMIGIGVARAVGLSEGDALLLAVLAGSASYIAVPAALRLSLPSANASVYVPMSLGLTFPFNVVIGIPLYWAVVQLIWN